MKKKAAYYIAFIIDNLKIKQIQSTLSRSTMPIAAR